MARNVTVGQEAPDFTLMDMNGQLVALHDYKGKAPVVLIFYPKDNTPGCTRQMCAVRDAEADYAGAGAVVLGLNGDSASSHQSFTAKHNLTVRLLTDKGLDVARQYDAVMGIGPLAIVNRTVVVVGTDGVVRFYERGTPATPAILAAIEQSKAAAGAA